jgi:hypothetical protein
MNIAADGRQGPDRRVGPYMDISDDNGTFVNKNTSPERWHMAFK